MFIDYPKMKTLFKLNPLDVNGRKWDATSGEILPETSPLHFLPLDALVFTEKIDGTNMGLMVAGNNILVQKRNGLCSREDNNDRFYFEVADKLTDGILSANINFNTYYIFGELCGSKIQKGGNYFEDRKFIVFDILNMATDKFLTWEAVVDVAGILKLETVPEVKYTGDNLDVNTVKDFVGGLKSAYNKDYNAEGVVIRYGKDTSLEKRWMAKIRRNDFRWE